ncbi:MAG: hypothetical protein ACJAYJ_003180 [Saprospiraceae bacterium]
MENINFGNEVIDVSNLGTGVYFLQFQTESRVVGEHFFGK